MNSKYQVFDSNLMRYVEVCREVPAAAEIDINEIEDALLKFVDDMINS